METNNHSREWFISEYDKIHSNLNSLEKEITELSNNELTVLENPEILGRLRKRIEVEIEKLNKTRTHEREIFKY